MPRIGLTYDQRNAIIKKHKLKCCFQFEYDNAGLGTNGPGGIQGAIAFDEGYKKLFIIKPDGTVTPASVMEAYLFYDQCSWKMGPPSGTVDAQVMFYRKVAAHLRELSAALKQASKQKRGKPALAKIPPQEVASLCSRQMSREELNQAVCKKFGCNPRRAANAMLNAWGQGLLQCSFPQQTWSPVTP